jgi:hypothetical protein
MGNCKSAENEGIIRINVDEENGLSVKDALFTADVLSLTHKVDRVYIHADMPCDRKIKDSGLMEAMLKFDLHLKDFTLENHQISLNFIHKAKPEPQENVTDK